MNEIIKITIKGESGYGPGDKAYHDKIIIEQGSIRYEYNPIIESDVNTARKWSYKTTNPTFQKRFTDAAVAVEKILNWEDLLFCTDVGLTSFMVIYADKTKCSRDFFLPRDDFKECFSIIKKMVPDCEYMPTTLLTSEDYEE